ncbi:MAG: DNA polymerase/3'-5' exonuclease PolX [Balneola sp.]|nr:DNA polymerase/3'-5' exonuclease PolX [Balneola sp.]MAO76334.1 DNA polymerase/3'-5' exonuclease PolX [Balneola sp.]MBF65525.1 DNA polymerase/3'-5' exonuclease PolX [Balneola sp.]HAW80587.1 DNA polymerase/3'-5' exonuclease PolX [Balneola sp.]|tara:strand:+ start:2469 stop:4226 length:1758 start_codon:yes stop_codon:yes gene_type:complete
MPSNQDIASKLREVFQLMQLAGENRFKAIAFDKAALTIDGMSDDINEYINNKNLTDIKGIGKSIAEDIYAYAETGKMPVLEAFREKIPPGLLKWTEISGLGPKNILKIHETFGITEIEELKELINNGDLAKLPGLGGKSAEKIQKSIEWMEKYDERCRLDEAQKIADDIYISLKDLEGVQQIELAGSLRRSKETIGDIDILIAADEKYIPGLFEVFTNHGRVTEVLGKGDTKSSVRTTDGRQVDLRIVKPENFAAALMYFTGSKEHNVELRSRARNKGMSLNEYGLYKLKEDGDTDWDAPQNFKTESDIYKLLDLNFVPPELREDRGEFEIFETHKGIDLVTDDDIRGVIHAHSTWSDGKFSIKEMAEACIERGYEYLGITDHSQTAAYAGGLKPDEVKQQWDEIDALNEGFKSSGTNFVIFKGIESDILADGSLDYDDDILEGFDFVIASVHQSLEMPENKMMERFRNAIKNPYTRMIGHPTGRLLLKREESKIDLNELVALAAEHNTAIEINANPRRLDLDWKFGNKAKEVGMMTSINPDAHNIDGIDLMSYGVRIARKGKYEKERVLNTKSAEEVIKFFKTR